MAHCPTCGKAIPATPTEAKFCYECGASLPHAREEEPSLRIGD